MVKVLGHQINTIYEGLTGFVGENNNPIPLKASNYSLDINNGLAKVRVARTFINEEEEPIEAVLTLPVGLEAVVTGLEVEVEGRVLKAAAYERGKARETYEEALDEGKLAVIHEELLHGIHILSIGKIAPKLSVCVTIHAVYPLAPGPDGPFLRIPTTVGEIYGQSPFLAVDDIATSQFAKYEASVAVSVRSGKIKILDEVFDAKHAEKTITLDQAIEIHNVGAEFGTVFGKTAYGGNVSIKLEDIPIKKDALDIAILCDRSASTLCRSSKGTQSSVFDGIRNSVIDAAKHLRPTDRVSLWQFNDSCELVGKARGAKLATLAHKMEDPAGGTELGRAIKTAIDAGQKDLLLLTDGKSWASLATQTLPSDVRVSAILIGSSSLDVSIGRLCTASGGQLFYCSDGSAEFVLEMAINALRGSKQTRDLKLSQNAPSKLKTLKSGVQISAVWSTSPSDDADANYGAFASSLALPFLEKSVATELALAHGLCSNTTSLVLVDHDGKISLGHAAIRKVPLMAAADAQMSANSFSNIRAKASYRYDLMASYDDQWIAPQRASSAKSVRKISTKTRNKSWISRLLSKDRSTDKELINALGVFDKFDWMAHLPEIKVGNLSMLNREQRKSVELLAKQSVTKSYVNPDAAFDLQVAALRRIAEKIGSREAMRFVAALQNETRH